MFSPVFMSTIFLISLETKQKKTNPVVFVRKRTISTERPPFVGEVGANFGLRVSRGHSNESPQSLISVF
jgi:hypothetical protein